MCHCVFSNLETSRENNASGQAFSGNFAEICSEGDRGYTIAKN